MDEQQKDKLRHLKWIFLIGLVGLVALIIGYLFPNFLEGYPTEYLAMAAIRLVGTTIGAVLIFWLIQRLTK